MGGIWRSPIPHYPFLPSIASKFNESSYLGFCFPVCCSNFHDLLSPNLIYTNRNAEKLPKSISALSTWIEALDSPDLGVAIGAYNLLTFYYDNHWFRYPLPASPFASESILKEFESRLANPLELALIALCTQCDYSIHYIKKIGRACFQFAKAVNRLECYLMLSFKWLVDARHLAKT